MFLLLYFSFRVFPVERAFLRLPRVTLIVSSIIASFEDEARWISDAGNAATISNSLFPSVVDSGFAESAFGLVAGEGDGDGGGEGVSLVCDTLGCASLVSVCCCGCSCFRGLTAIGSLVRSSGFLGFGPCRLAWGVEEAAWLVLRSGCFCSSSFGAGCFFS